MPELPVIEVYVHALRARILNRVLNGVVLISPFLLRTVDPPPSALSGLRVTGLSRLGKRVVFGFESDLYMVIHLMIAGRLQWLEVRKKTHPRGTLASFEFPDGRLVLTETGTKRRASLHVVRGADALRILDPGGIEPLTMTLDAFKAQLMRENHTLKRALTDPTLFSGIGNAYSDEILHAAQLSPIVLTKDLPDSAVEGLHRAIVSTLESWKTRLMEETGDGFPRHVTAFRETMAVHGRYGKPCPVCAAPVQRIVYAENETNYCARCQTGGKILADRALSRLLKTSWPRSIDDL